MAYHYASFPMAMPPAPAPAPMTGYYQYGYPQAPWPVMDPAYLPQPYIPGAFTESGISGAVAPSTPPSGEEASPPSILGDHPSDIISRTVLCSIPPTHPSHPWAGHMAFGPDSPSDGDPHAGKGKGKKGLTAHSRFKPLEFRLTAAEEDCESLREDVRGLKTDTDTANQRVLSTLEKVRELEEMIKELSLTLRRPSGSGAVTHQAARSTTPPLPATGVASASSPGAPNP